LAIPIFKIKIMSYKISVNEQETFELDPKTWDDLDIQQVKDGTFHILQAGRSITATVLQADYVQKAFSIRIGSNVYQLQVKDRFDLLAEQLGFGAAGAKKLDVLKAPMPGLVRSISVQEGQAVQKGEAILILEAMKMENIIKAAHDGVVKKIAVQEGQAVEKNAVLVSFI
jgi:biotin carboxyl carrier protein